MCASVRECVRVCVSGCVCECEDTYLLALRWPHQQTNTDTHASACACGSGRERARKGERKVGSGLVGAPLAAPGADCEQLDGVAVAVGVGGRAPW